MKTALLFLTIFFTVNIQSVTATIQNNDPILNPEDPIDSIRLAEIDQYWTELIRTVKEGDFEGYKALYHSDAVVVFAGGKNKTSVPIAKALAGWEKGFKNTKEGKNKDKVEFRFSQRIGDETTAHETGIFVFTSTDSDGNVKGKYMTHFEMLMVKKDNTWLAVMEYQKSEASQAEWDALK